MIALDTNILVRYFAAADGEDSGRAARLIERTLSAEARGFVSAVTLCEIIWVLAARYGFDRVGIAAIVRLMLDAPQLVLEHAREVAVALDSGHADITDALIHEIGRRAGCSHTLTFDKKFARLEGVELLA